MSDKFCPAGKVPCERFSSKGAGDTDAPVCLPAPDYNNWVRNLNEHEQCPWPSKQKIVESRFEKAYERFSANLVISFSPDQPARTGIEKQKWAFFKALEDLGFKDE